LQLDHVYTARLFYGVACLLKENRFSQGAQILLVHSGGLQGNAAFEARYGLETV
jgi:1-aminocyclopropane-1-carboxylate deaminase